MLHDRGARDGDIERAAQAELFERRADIFEMAAQPVVVGQADGAARAVGKVGG